MLGILRGSLVTAISGIIGDASDDSKTKVRRMINTCGPAFCQMTDWGFLHTTVTFTLTDGTKEYSGSGKIPYTFQRFLATKIMDTNGQFSPVDEKSLTWFNQIEDPSQEGTPYAVILRGLDSSGYPKTVFYPTPDRAYTFEADCKLQWTDVLEASGSDTSRIVITEDAFTAFSYYIAQALAIQQGDDALKILCDAELWGNPLIKKPGLLTMLIMNQRGANKKRGMAPRGDYTGYSTGGTDYGRPLK